MLIPQTQRDFLFLLELPAMHIFCKSLREEAGARDANFRNGKHEKKKDFAPNTEFKYGQRTQHLIHWHAELCAFLSPNAIMGPDLSGRCRDSRKSAESCRMKGLNVTGGSGRKEALRPTPTL